MTRWWLSFADGQLFKGACVVRAESSTAAHLKATRLGLNPGGSVLILPMPAGSQLDIPEDTLMSSEFIEANNIGKRRPEWVTDEMMVKRNAEILNRNKLS